MGLKQLPYNDMMAQFSKKLIKVTKEEEEKRINEISNCNHLFVKLREFNAEQNDNNLLIVECVHCGVTNKYCDLERVMSRYRRSLDYYVATNYHCINVEYMDNTIETRMMEEIKNSNTELNLMSDKILRSFHPGVLYRLAKMISPNADNDELFSIMQELNNIETFEEKNKLNNPSDATDLINRYNELEKGKVLIKK